jgi:hypothetical protein
MMFFSSGAKCKYTDCQGRVNIKCYYCSAFVCVEHTKPKTGWVGYLLGYKQCLECQITRTISNVYTIQPPTPPMPIPVPTDISNVNSIQISPSHRHDDIDSEILKNIQHKSALIDSDDEDENPNSNEKIYKEVGRMDTTEEHLETVIINNIINEPAIFAPTNPIGCSHSDRVVGDFFNKKKDMNVFKSQSMDGIITQMVNRTGYSSVSSSPVMTYIDTFVRPLPYDFTGSFPNI